MFVLYSVEFTAAHAVIAANFEHVQLMSPTEGALSQFVVSGATLASTSTPEPLKLVIIKGTDAVALASGFHYYLKYVANCSVSWLGDQLELTAPLPQPAQPIALGTTFMYRYYMAPVTFGYSTAFWNWTRWQREIGAGCVARCAASFQFTAHAASCCRLDGDEWHQHAACGRWHGAIHDSGCVLVHGCRSPRRSRFFAFLLGAGVAMV